jgi:tRNA dimethylallyltransferase
MIKLGAISEVRRFIKMRVPKNKSLSKAIGINEIKQYLQKKIQIEQLIEKISIKTRQYAKRQSTWARGNMKDWNKLNPSGLDKLLKKI